MSTMTQSPPRKCDRCERPARPEDVELVLAFPRMRLSCLCEPCQRAEDAEQAKRILAQRERQEAIAREARLDIIPPKIRRTDKTRPDFNLNLWQRVQGWQPSSGRWLGLVGNAGQCKTRCIGLLAERLIMEGHRLMWTTAVEFQERTDDTRSDSRQIRSESSEYFRECRSASILVLDDFGKNTWTPTVERNLFSLIDYRGTHDLPVLWSANTHPKEIFRSGELSKDRSAPLIGRILESSTIETA
jgi:hypothetical protein